MAPRLLARLARVRGVGLCRASSSVRDPAANANNTLPVGPIPGPRNGAVQAQSRSRTTRPRWPKDGASSFSSTATGCHGGRAGGGMGPSLRDEAWRYGRSAAKFARSRKAAPRHAGLGSAGRAGRDLATRLLYTIAAARATNPRAPREYEGIAMFRGLCSRARGFRASARCSPAASGRSAATGRASAASAKPPRRRGRVRAIRPERQRKSRRARSGRADAAAVAASQGEAGGFFNGRNEWAAIVDRRPAVRPGRVCDGQAAAAPRKPARSRRPGLYRKRLSTRCTADVDRAVLYFSLPGTFALQGIAAKANPLNPACLGSRPGRTTPIGRICGGTIAFGGGCALYPRPDARRRPGPERRYAPVRTRDREARARRGRAWIRPEAGWSTTSVRRASTGATALRASAVPQYLAQRPEARRRSARRGLADNEPDRLPATHHAQNSSVGAHVLLVYAWARSRSNYAPRVGTDADFACMILIIAVLLSLAMMRRRPREEADSAGMPRIQFPARGIEWIYIGAEPPSIVLVASAIWTFHTIAAVAAPPATAALSIEIFRAPMVVGSSLYRSGQRHGHVYPANEIHIPVGQPVRFELKSPDVIHSFWIPQLAGKTDVIPGQTNVSWMQADAAGTYRGQCAEYMRRAARAHGAARRR